MENAGTSVAKCLRLIGAAALAPAFAGAVFFWGGTTDWLLHRPADSCLARVQSGHVSALLFACGVIVMSRVAICGLGLVAEVWRSQCAIRSWRRCLQTTRKAGRVLPLEEPHAFVLGIFRPEIYMSEGLLSMVHSESLEPVLMHEEAHVRRRDPLWRLIASIGRLVHLPGVAESVGRLHERAVRVAYETTHLRKHLDEDP
jgi:hypothetical protein